MVEQAEQICEMFNRLAPKYDRANRVLSLGRDQAWRRAAVQAMKAPADGLVLDVAAGSADVALMLAPQVRQVIAMDFSAEMLAHANRKAIRASLQQKVQFVQGDALAMPFPANFFDGAIIAFGLRNLVDVRKGLDELARVVKPQARVVILEFSMPSSKLLRTLYRPYLHGVAPVLGRLVTGMKGPYQYLARSIENFLSMKELGQLMTAAGLAEVTIHQLNLGTVATHVGVKAPANY